MAGRSIVEMAVLFSCLKVGEMRLCMEHTEMYEIIMSEKILRKVKKIYCPRCGRRVAFYDGRQTINPMGKCKKCHKLVVYDIEKDEVIIKDLPKRDCSSGMVFV